MDEDDDILNIEDAEALAEAVTETEEFLTEDNNRKDLDNND